MTRLPVLSVVRGTVRPVFPDPWRRLADDHPEVVVEYADLGTYRWGMTRWFKSRPPVITLHSGLSQVKRRCVLAHELEHIAMGMPCEGTRATTEVKVQRRTALYLLPDLRLLARTVAVYDLRRAADELWVTFPVLVDRLNFLSDADSRYVHSMREGVA